MKINIMIVDDSIVIRAMLAQLLNKYSEEFEITASARNGVEALYLLKTKEVDVIIMDIEMPEMNGIETLEEIMKTNPKPVIMFSTLTEEGAKETLEALDKGAIDFLKKPMKQGDLIQLKEEIYKKIKAAYQSKNITRNTMRKINEVKINNKEIGKEIKNLVLIGTSTGGPKALKEILESMPEKTDACILIVQHMPEGSYVKTLAEQLDRVSKLKVKTLEDKEELKNGMVYLSVAGKQPKIKKERGRFYSYLTNEEKESGHRPSVDYLFKSVAKNKLLEEKIIAVILTGMGADGAKGSEILKTEYPKTEFIIESEETTIVYGMPRQVKKAVGRVTEKPLYDIPNEIIKKINETIL